MSERSGDEITTSEGPRRSEPTRSSTPPRSSETPRSGNTGVGGEVTQSERDVIEHEKQRTQPRQGGADTTEPSSRTVDAAETPGDGPERPMLNQVHDALAKLREYAMTLKNSDELAAILQSAATIETNLATITTGFMAMRSAEATSAQQDVPA